MHPDRTFWRYQFCNAWTGTVGSIAGRLNGTLFMRSARFDRPTLWLYGDQDPFYDIQHSRNNFMLFQGTGRQCTFLQINVPRGYGHAVLSARELWDGPVAEYLSSLPERISAAGKVQDKSRTGYPPAPGAVGNRSTGLCSRLGRGQDEIIRRQAQRRRDNRHESRRHPSIAA